MVTLIRTEKSRSRQQKATYSTRGAKKHPSQVGQEPTKGLAEYSYPYSTVGIVNNPDYFPIPNYLNLFFSQDFAPTTSPTTCFQAELRR